MCFTVRLWSGSGRRRREGVPARPAQDPLTLLPASPLLRQSAPFPAVCRRGVVSGTERAGKRGAAGAGLGERCRSRSRHLQHELQHPTRTLLHLLLLHPSTLRWRSYRSKSWLLTVKTVDVRVPVLYRAIKCLHLREFFFTGLRAALKYDCILVGPSICRRLLT